MTDDLKEVAPPSDPSAVLTSGQIAYLRGHWTIAGNLHVGQLFATIAEWKPRAEAAEATFGHREREATNQVLDALRASLQANGEALEKLMRYSEVAESEVAATNEAWSSLAADILGTAPETPEEQRAAIAAELEKYRAPFERCARCRVPRIDHDRASSSHKLVGSGEYVDPDEYGDENYDEHQPRREQ